jgi:hypothetical protein
MNPVIRCSVAALILVASLASADDEKKTKRPPADAKKVSLDEFPFKPGDKITRTTYRKDSAGTETKLAVQVVAPEKAWLTGIDGADAPDGFYVLGVRKVDRPDGKTSAPAEDITVRVRGAKGKTFTRSVKLQPGDVIVWVGREKVMTRTDIILAAHDPNVNPQALEIGWISGDSGSTVYGVISLVPVKK